MGKLNSWPTYENPKFVELHVRKPAIQARTGESTVMVFQSRLSWSMGCLHEIPPAGLLNILNTAQMKGRRGLQIAHLLLNHLVLDVPEAALGRFFSCLADWKWITLGPLGYHPKIAGIYGCSSPFNYGISWDFIHAHFCSSTTPAHLSRQATADL